MKIFDKIFSWSVEELRRELCLVEYEEFRVRTSQIKDKFRETLEMLEKQEKVHKTWHDYAKRRKKN